MAEEHCKPFPVKLDVTVDSLEKLEKVNPVLRDIGARLGKESSGFDFSLSFSLSFGQEQPLG